MKSVLIVATVHSFISLFEKEDIRILKKLGYNVSCASNMEGYNDELSHLGVEMIHVPFSRSPLSIKNIISYKKMKKILNSRKFDLMHVHTPMGGVIGRLAASKHKDIKVIYTAHGFHFYKGAPIKNWVLYYSIEKYLSKKTDILITINSEDYNRAKKNFNSSNVKYIPGIGVDLEKNRNILANIDRSQKRKSIGISDNDFLILSVGELSTRKNQSIIIEAISKIDKGNIKYVICGEGIKKNYFLERAVELGVGDNLILLGQRKDIIEIMSCADLFVFPSLQEGLPVALMEAMSVKLPVLVSNIRGNIDLVKDDKMLVKSNSLDEWIEKISDVINKENIEFDDYNMNKFDVNNISSEMKKIYLSICK